MQTDVSLPTFASNRGRVSLTARYLGRARREMPSGMDSDKDARRSSAPWGGGGRLDFDLSQHQRWRRQLHRHRPPAGATGPSIEERFSPADTPGLELDQFVVNSTARAVFDWRSRLGYAGSGGLYGVQFDDFRENDNDQCSCPFAQERSVQMIPLMRANWVIALQGLHDHRHRRDGSRSVASCCRRAGRWQDPARLPGLPFPRSQPAGHECRAALDSRFLDMAVFYDTGKVTARKGISISRISRTRTGSACGSSA